MATGLDPYPEEAYGGFIVLTIEHGKVKLYPDEADGMVADSMKLALLQVSKHQAWRGRGDRC